MRIEDLPVEIQEQIKQSELILKEYRRKYYQLHQVCPSCNKRSFTTTYMWFAMDIDHLNEYKDLNDVKCKCGWIGTIHDLIPNNN